MRTSRLPARRTLRAGRFCPSVLKLVWLLVLVILNAGCESRPPIDGSDQHVDDEFPIPDTGPPAFETGQGPIVGIDEAHYNFHTAGGRYRPFAELLRKDGYRVRRFAHPLTAETLDEVQILVISNAIAKEQEVDWRLPSLPAFTDDEVVAVESWVRDGGRLMLIADHMPHPGAAANLARSLGIVFYNGYALNADGTRWMTFKKSDGSLEDHAVTSDEGGGDIPFVKTFSGQAFRPLAGTDATPLFHLADDSYVLLPSDPQDLGDATPRIPGVELLQGALVNHGYGRVAVFGEAATFTAQVRGRADNKPAGMNHPDAPHNARFLLNIMRWLAS